MDQHNTPQITGESSTWHITIISNPQSKSSSPVPQKTPKMKKVIINKPKPASKDPKIFLTSKKSPIKLLQKISPRKNKKLSSGRMRDFLTSNTTPKSLINRFSSPRSKFRANVLFLDKKNCKNFLKEEDSALELQVKNMKEGFLRGGFEQTEAKDKLILELFEILDKRKSILKNLQEELTSIQLSRRLFEESKPRKHRKKSDHFFRENYKKKMMIFDEKNQNGEIFKTHNFSNRKRVSKEIKKIRTQRGYRSSSNPSRINNHHSLSSNSRILNKATPRKNHQKKPKNFFNFSILSKIKQKLKVEKFEKIPEQLDLMIQNFGKYEKLVNALSKLAEELSFGKYKFDDFKKTPKLIWKWIKIFFSEYMDIKQKELNFKILVDCFKKANLKFNFNGMDKKENIEIFVNKFFLERNLKIQELEILEKKVKIFFGFNEKFGVRKLVEEIDKKINQSKA